ncbi:MAG TPA: hypothetical protein VK694_07255 [Verrucomicrobiae bacterium]|nr:hypothetical protein [Verrucomicrobiae bacterium]
MAKKDFWLDDPEWEILRRRAEKRPVPKKLKQQARPQPKLRLPREEPRAEITRQVAEKQVVVNLQLRMPRFKLLGIKQRFRQLRKSWLLMRARNKRAVMAGVALVCLMGGFGVLNLLKGGDQAGQGGGPVVTAQQQAETDFNPLVPLENLTDANGQQSRPDFKYDKEKKVLGYVAEFNGASLTISQQPAPGDFKSNPAKLMSVAESFKATTHLDTQKGTAYIASDEKTKVQTAIFATDEVLVFVRSNKPLDNDEWQMYINQLNPSE